MSKLLHDADKDHVKPIAVPRIFSETSQAKNLETSIKALAENNLT